jgi:hypothetical protein
MTQEELNKIIEQHQHWIHEDVDDVLKEIETDILGDE